MATYNGTNRWILSYFRFLRDEITQSLDNLWSRGRLQRFGVRLSHSSGSGGTEV